MTDIAKNKKTVVTLLVAVLAIWSIIAYKIITAITAKPVAIKNNPIKTKQTKTIDEDYVLHHYDRDPFLSILVDTATIIIKPEPVLQASPTRPLANHPRPVFCGTMKGQTGIIALIKIDNTYHFLAKGQQDSILKVVSLNDTIATVIYHSDKLTLPTTKMPNKLRTP